MWLRSENAPQKPLLSADIILKRWESIRFQLHLQCGFTDGRFVLQYSLDLLLHTKVYVFPTSDRESRGVPRSARGSLGTSKCNMRKPCDRIFTLCTPMDAFAAVLLTTHFAIIHSSAGWSEQRCICSKDACRSIMSVYPPPSRDNCWLLSYFLHYGRMTAALNTGSHASPRMRWRFA